MSGKALSILRRSSLAQTMKAFIGRFTCDWRFSSRDSLLVLAILPPNKYPVKCHDVASLLLLFLSLRKVLNKTSLNAGRHGS